MSNRDDFSPKTKLILRDRAGNRCSFPSCRAPTSGSSDESDTAIDSTGMACHIFAAAPGKGAKRYDPTMTPEERKSPENGIWMCYKHGKQIDNDECRFTSEILFKWKEISEKIAQIENELGRSIHNGNDRISSLSLANLEIEIKENNEHLNSKIGDALRESCASVIWGTELIQYIRGYLIERARNALTHGKATTVKLIISAKKITLIDNGDYFSHQDLLNHPNARGGAETKHELLKKFGNKILSVSQRINNENHSTIAPLRKLGDLKSLTACTIEISARHLLGKNYGIETLETCSEIYVALPDYFSISDQHSLMERLPITSTYSKPLVFVIDDVADYMGKHLLEMYPNARIMKLEHH